MRASIGTLFYIPIAEATTEETIAFLRKNNIQILSATPHASAEYFDVDMKVPTAIVVGAEQFGLSDTFMNEANLNVQKVFRCWAKRLFKRFNCRNDFAL